MERNGDGGGDIAVLGWRFGGGVEMGKWRAGMSPQVGDLCLVAVFGSVVLFAVIVSVYYCIGVLCGGTDCCQCSE